MFKGKSIQARIVEALLERKLIDESRLKGVLGKEREKDVIRKLADSDVISEEDLVVVLSQELEIPPIDMARMTLDPKLMGLVPEKVAQRDNFAIISRIGNGLTVVISDPTDVFAIDDVKTITGCSVELVVAGRQNLRKALTDFYAREEEDVTAIIDVEEEGEADLEILRGAEGIDVSDIEKSGAAPIVKMVNLIIGEGLKKRVSDIHIEPEEKTLRVRYRIDGEMQEAFELPKKNQNAVLARLKIMSNLDITENRVPQDGRFRINMEDREIDFRVSVLPTTFGNKIVLRALDKGSLSVGLETLGFLPQPLEDFKTALSMPFGIILVTGPTGSGKSTTLYSILTDLNIPDRNIMTVEDPVEYQVEGLTQIAARPDIGLDFTSGLRAILRQSPDIIMVGEIRDFETADIAIKASLTGQMVLSTLHTNDSVGAITRLTNMGIEPFLIASSLLMACAQRLMRKICPHCKVEDKDLPQDFLKELAEKHPCIRETKKFYKGKGCAKCNDTGYLGRMGTLETLLVDDKIREMINRKQSEEDLRQYLNEKGAKTLRENAVIKFCKGWTTLEEVLRVT
ncbi:MAG: GspE/PulE family protein [Candidatus Omnitrophota bacterium]